MEQTVFLFCSRTQFVAWRAENCGNCRKEAAAHPGCDLSAALRDTLFPEGTVPLNMAERLGYFDMDDDAAFPPGAWTCREFQGRHVPPAQSRFTDRKGRPGGPPSLSPRPAASE